MEYISKKVAAYGQFVLVFIIADMTRQRVNNVVPSCFFVIVPYSQLLIIEEFTLL